MEVFVNEGVISGEEVFKSCGRMGRWGVCIGIDIECDKL